MSGVLLVRLSSQDVQLHHGGRRSLHNVQPQAAGEQRPRQGNGTMHLRRILISSRRILSQSFFLYHASRQRSGQSLEDVKDNGISIGEVLQGHKRRLLGVIGGRIVDVETPQVLARVSGDGQGSHDLDGFIRCVLLGNYPLLTVFLGKTSSNERVVPYKSDVNST